MRTNISSYFRYCTSFSPCRVHIDRIPWRILNERADINAPTPTGVKPSSSALPYNWVAGDRILLNSIVTWYIFCRLFQLRTRNRSDFIANIWLRDWGSFRKSRVLIGKPALSFYTAIRWPPYCQMMNNFYIHTVWADLINRIMSTYKKNWFNEPDLTYLLPCLYLKLLDQIGIEANWTRVDSNRKRDLSYHSTAISATYRLSDVHQLLTY